MKVYLIILPQKHSPTQHRPLQAAQGEIEGRLGAIFDAVRTTSAPTDYSTRLCGNSHRNLHTISEVPRLSCEDFKRGLLSVLKNVKLQRKHHRFLPHANANQPRVAHSYLSQGSSSTTASFTHWQGTRGMGLEISASAPKRMTLRRFSFV